MLGSIGAIMSLKNKKIESLQEFIVFFILSMLAFLFLRTYMTVSSNVIAYLLKQYEKANNL